MWDRLPAGKRVYRTDLIPTKCLLNRYIHIYYLFYEDKIEDNGLKNRAQPCSIDRARGTYGGSDWG